MVLSFLRFPPLPPVGLHCSAAAVVVLNCVAPQASKTANQPTGACPLTKHHRNGKLTQGRSLLLRYHSRPVSSCFCLLYSVLSLFFFLMLSRDCSHYLWEDLSYRSHYPIFLNYNPLLFLRTHLFKTVIDIPPSPCFFPSRP